MASLVGLKLPDVSLLATSREWVNLSQESGKLVVFIYPYTGVPGTPDPEDWDNILGAHGSTPQALAFSYRYQEFQILDVKVFGLSLQDTIWQTEFVQRTQLAFPLLSDSTRSFSSALKLETFKAGEKDYLVRRAIVAEQCIITHDFYPVPQPAANADEVLKVFLR